MVEAAGVEPASENVTGQEPTCVVQFMPQALPWGVRERRSERTRPEENMASRLFSDTDLAPEELQRHILSTYMNIRFGIAVIGIVFPFSLWLGGYAYAR